MQLIVDQSVIDLFPALRIGVAIATGVTNAKFNAALQERKQRARDEFVSKYNADNLLSHPNIGAWRETYRAFGVKAKRYKPTAEALLRRLIHGEALPTISCAVDQYLVVETKYLLPIGGYDLDRVVGNIRLVVTEGGDSFVPLGNRDKIEETKPGEVIYRDGERVLTRKWNFRDCDDAKITVETRTLGLFCEGAMPEVSLDDIQGSVNMMAQQLVEFCGGAVDTFLLDCSKENAITILQDTGA